jgi:hypothetical protein
VTEESCGIHLGQTQPGHAVSGYESIEDRAWISGYISFGASEKRKIHRYLKSQGLLFKGEAEVT